MSLNNVQLNNALQEICEGGSLIIFCKKHKLKYSETVNWIYDDKDRQKKYETALQARGEWVAQRLLAELQRIGFVDIRKLFNDDGSIRNVSELSDEVAAAVAGIDIQEARFDKDGDEVEPRTRKIKLVDKLKAIELLGKNLKMFTDKHEHSGTLSLEELVVGSMQPEPEPKPDPTPEAVDLEV